MPITAGMDPGRVPDTIGVWASSLTQPETTPIPSKEDKAWGFPTAWGSLWIKAETTAMNAIMTTTMAGAPFPRHGQHRTLFGFGRQRQLSPSVTENDTTWVRSSYGIGRDTNFYDKVKTKQEELESAEMPAEDAPIEEIFAIASEWEVAAQFSA